MPVARICLRKSKFEKVNRNLKEYFNQLIVSILFWVGALMLLCYFRYYGVDMNPGNVFRGVLAQKITFPKMISFFALSGLMFGFLSANVEFIINKLLSKRISIGMHLLIHLVAYFLMVVFVFTSIRHIASEILQMEINHESGWWREEKAFYVYLLFIALAAVVLSFVRVALDKFGKRQFMKMLLGEYKKPKEENRIFMFLDLKSSTTIAEQLGHFKYSQLIQDCFYDLNEVIPHYDAEIYQYVGDEAVLSWSYEKGLANNNCVDLFFAFDRLLKSKSDYYTNKYGTVPQFKAGLHGGKLMVAEVGVVKKEIAYHGDVINTSARIQEECNKYEVPILISEELLEKNST